MPGPSHRPLTGGRATIRNQSLDASAIAREFSEPHHDGRCVRLSLSAANVSWAAICTDASSDFSHGLAERIVVDARGMEAVAFLAHPESGSDAEREV